MAIVMPRSFSSGALSIWSKGVKSARPLSASTLVMAAVSVVLPWSMCPIVPMLMWGLLRSNFFLAISGRLLFGGSSRGADSTRRHSDYEPLALPLSYPAWDRSLPGGAEHLTVVERQSPRSDRSRAAMHAGPGGDRLLVRPDLLARSGSRHSAVRA